MMDTVKMNIGGVIFETTFKTLSSKPNTRLGQLSLSSKEYNTEKEYFFFDRNAEMFSCILDLYRTGQLHMPLHMCGATFRRELEFWKIKPDLIEECCFQYFYKYEKDKEILDMLKTSFCTQNVAIDNKSESLFKKIRKRIWIFFDNPASSRPAMIFSYVFMAFVVLSSLMFCFQTHSAFRVPRQMVSEVAANQKNNFLNKFYSFNTTSFNKTSKGTITASFNSKEALFRTTEPKHFILVVEDVSLMFFTIEFLFHFGSCPNYCSFFKSLLNCIDLTVLIIMWTVYGMENNPVRMVTSDTAITAYVYLKACIILRLLRFLRFLKQYKGLRILILAMNSCYKELTLLFFAFFTAAIFFASLMFYAEFAVPDRFENIFECLWWAIITMTTVGYGDTYPKSTGGYIVGSVCAISGVLILSLPIAAISTRFSELYERNNENELHEKQKIKERFCVKVHPILVGTKKPID